MATAVRSMGRIVRGLELRDGNLLRAIEIGEECRGVAEKPVLTMLLNFFILFRYRYHSPNSPGISRFSIMVS